MAELTSAELEEKIAAKKAEMEKLRAHGLALIAEGADKIDTKSPDATPEQILKYYDLQKTGIRFNTLKSTLELDEYQLKLTKRGEEINKKLKLPKTKDPNLLKQEVEADALKKKSEAEQLALTAKDKIIEKGLQLLGTLAIPALPVPLKLPVLDPKILQAVALALQLKKLIKDKQNKSKENLKKAKETYKYPLKPKVEELPPIPPIPVANPATNTEPPPQAKPAPTPMETFRPPFKYKLEIQDETRKRKQWRVEVNDARTSEFLDVLFYSTKQYPNKDQVIQEVTLLIKTTGLVGFPPQRDFVFPG